MGNAEIIFKIAGIGLLITFISIVLKKADREDVANLLAIGGIAIVSVMVLGLISELFQTIREVFLWIS